MQSTYGTAAPSVPWKTFSSTDQFIFTFTISFTLLQFFTKYNIISNTLDRNSYWDAHRIRRRIDMQNAFASIQNTVLYYKFTTSHISEYDSSIPHRRLSITIRVFFLLPHNNRTIPYFFSNNFLHTRMYRYHDELESFRYWYLYRVRRITVALPLKKN